LKEDNFYTRDWHEFLLNSTAGNPLRKYLLGKFNTTSGDNELSMVSAYIEVLRFFIKKNAKHLSFVVGVKNYLHPISKMYEIANLEHEKGEVKKVERIDPNTRRKTIETVKISTPNP